MKLITLFVLVATIFVGTLQAQTRSDERITMSFSNIPLSAAMKNIEKETKYTFFYDAEIDTQQRVSLSANNIKIEEAMEQMLRPTNLTFKITNTQIALLLKNKKQQTSMATSKKITGRVTDDKGAAVFGATVMVVGTTTGTTTDADGKFSLTVSVGASLKISYIGYLTKTITVGNQDKYEIVISEDAQNLDEVVVIGYGTAKKSDLTGAVSHADLSVMENASNTNVLQAIKGVVPGLNVGIATQAGEDPSLSIRGRNSISGTLSPLIVVDGIIYRGAMTDINPNDIASIDVLKDASSTAIYGSQAANGVLMITTKTSKELSKPIIEYSASFAFQSLMNGKMDRLDREGFLNQLADVDIANSRMGEDLLERNPDFDVTKLFRDEKIIQGYYNGTDEDWLGLMSNKVPYIQNHNINLRGKSELVGYFLSFGYTDQKNLIKNDTYKRYNLRINLDAKVTDWLKIGTQSFFTISDMSGSNPSFSTICEIPALASPYNEDGSLMDIPYRNFANPLLSIDNPDKDIRYNLTGNMYADVTIPWVKGLSYRLNYSNGLIWYKRFQFDPFENTQLGQASKQNNSEHNWTLDNIITYKRDFNKHAINATLVYGVEKRTFEDTYAESNIFVDQSLGYDNMGVGQSDQNVVSSQAWEESSLYAMARIGYTYDDKYILNATIRRDGFSGFGEGDKIGYFPSAAVAWRLSEESFIKNNVEWINNLKLRLSYGMNGNRTAGRYATMAKMSSYMNFSGGWKNIEGGYLFGDGATPELTQAISTLANHDLKWETTTSLNMGIDFGFFNNRLFGSYDAYISNTSNLLYDITIPNINGMTPNSDGDITVATNIGKLKNTGHELTITGIPVRTKNFEWTVTGNFAINFNKVVSVLGLDLDGDGKEDDLVSSNLFIGKPLSAIYDYNIIGMWQIEDYKKGIIPDGFTYGVYKIEDRNHDGKYTAEFDRDIIGYADPLYRFSIINNFKYKNWELRFMINSVQGGGNHYMGQPLKSCRTPDQFSNSSFFKFDYWTPENPGAKYRQLGAYNETCGVSFSPYVQRNFIRLQDLSLSYTFPSSMLQKVGINRVKLYVSATNLFTITNWDGWDPEADQGISYSLGDGYPTMKSFTFGLNFEF